MREYTTIVDAIFGIGLSRNIEGPYLELIEWINRQSSHVVAVDIPSGVSADTGQVLGTAVRADLTVTFAYRKMGQLLYPALLIAAKLSVVILGYRHSILREKKIHPMFLLIQRKICQTFQSEDLIPIKGRTGRYF